MYKHRFALTARFKTNTERGCVTLEVEADFPLKEYRAHPHLKYLDIVSCSSIEGARESVDTAARVIRFMDGAGVRPSQAWVSLFGAVSPCGFDHTLVWKVAGGRRLVTTEPYGRGLDDALRWCRDHRWEARRLPEWGMWNPPATTLLLCAPPRRGANLDVLLWCLRTQRPMPMDERQTAGIVTRHPRSTIDQGGAT